MRDKAIMMVYLFCILTSSAVGSAQKYPQENPFVLDANRPFVYLKFDHVGKGVRRSDDEPALRVWLRFVNNCSVPITLRANGVPKGSQPGEVGVNDDVVPDRPMLTITADNGEPQAKPEPDSNMRDSEATKNSEQSRAAKMPSGYTSEVFGLVIVASGQSVLFSVPFDHLGSSTGNWHMEIPFSFAVVNGRFPRDPAVGGEAMMSIWYAYYHLPDEARALLKLGRN
jgi:hypothetical protein